jgi:hypothetical protein
MQTPWPLADYSSRFAPAGIPCQTIQAAAKATCPVTQLSRLTSNQSAIRIIFTFDAGWTSFPEGRCA